MSRVRLPSLSSPDISHRDAAVCLLSFETGLRSVDICNLRLGDVDWKHNVIHIVQSKTQRPLNLPIRSSYENALVDYLLTAISEELGHKCQDSTMVYLSTDQDDFITYKRSLGYVYDTPERYLKHYQRQCSAISFSLPGGFVTFIR